jgi:glycosyltransferase involved in cell wall biosynthesis
MKPSVVLHVIPKLATGGAERMLAALVTAKRSEPIEPVVVELTDGGEVGIEIRAAGISVHSLGMSSVLHVPAAIARLGRLVCQIRPVAVQSWLYYADLVSLWALERSGYRQMSRLYWGVRCSDMDQSRYSFALRRAIAACAHRAHRVDAVVANSYAGRTVHRNLGYAPRAFPVIPNGIDTDRFKPDAEMRTRMRAELGISMEAAVVIHAARVDPMKDHASLIALARSLPNVTFLAVGEGTQHLAAPDNVGRLGIRQDVAALYSAGDIVLSTSGFGEGFSNTVAEAMACGLPAVATDVGDVRHIVGTTGEIIAPRDVVGMAAASARAGKPYAR